MFPPQNCSIDPGKTQDDYVYFVQAVCKSDEIDLFLLGKYYLDKETVAFIVVLIDVGISFLLFFLFQYLRAMQLQTNYEITESIVQAQDFAVEIRNLPDHENVRQLKAVMWHWLEQVNEKDRLRANNPINDTLDENQDTVMSIQFGLNDYGRLKYMLEMADMLKEKKRCENILKEDQGQNQAIKTKYTAEIDNL